jgi:hypothetical protein
MSLFASEEMFEIGVKYMPIKTKGGMETIRVFDEKTDKGKEEIQRYGAKILTLHTQWVSPNWKQSNELLRKCLKYDPESGRRDLDWPLYRAALLETFMRAWDATMAKDGGEAPVPCTKEFIDKLDAQVAVALVDKFLERTSVSEQDLGN